MDWETLIRRVMGLPSHTDITISKGQVSHPKLAGFCESLGEPQGQMADYRKRYGMISLHVREFGNSYRIHWDRRDPDVDPFGHLVEDAPHWLFLGFLGALAVGSILYAFSKSGNEESKEVI